MIRCAESSIRHRNRGIPITQKPSNNDHNDSAVVIVVEDTNTTTALLETMAIVNNNNKKEESYPPIDDVCPICFGDFSLPFITNCGHWFCGRCILQFWNYKASLQKCKCPICARLISKLTPEACLLGQQGKEVTEVLEAVHRYNNLFEDDVRGLRKNVVASTFIIKWLFQGLMNPDNIANNYRIARAVAVLVSLMYWISPFDFFLGGPHRVYNFIELCLVCLVGICCLIGTLHRAIIRRRIRHIDIARIEI